MTTGSTRRRVAEWWTELGEKPSSVPVLIAAVCSVATGILVATSRDWSPVGEHPQRALVFAVGALLLQGVAVDVYGRGAISFASTGILAVGFAVGVGPAAAIAVVAAAVRLATSRGKLYRGIYDAAQLAVAAAAATAAYHLVAATGGGAASRLPASVVAAAVYFLLNSTLLCAAMSLEGKLDPAAIWRERFVWVAPYALASGPLAVVLVTAYDHLGVLGVVSYIAPPVAMMVAIRQYVSRTREHVLALRASNDELIRLASQVRKTHRDTIASLSRSMAAKDIYTGGHVERVSDVAVALAQRLGYEGDDLDAIEIGALLHDIGKIGIPERILHKPGPLDEDEWDVMRRHPLISEFILTGIELHPFVAQIARSSHERIDGRGYPDGLAGDAIPLPARIVLVADAFDALTSDRPYRTRREADAALEEIYAHAGTQFCPRVVAALRELALLDPALLDVGRTAARAA